MKVIRLVILVAFACATSVAAQQAPQKGAKPAAAPPPIEIQTSVDRTALWVGDQITYLVELRCAPRVDILADDLAAERLPLQGLELVRVDLERDAAVPERLVYRIRYRLAAYEVDAPVAGIGAIPVRYHIRQPGMRAEDIVPAGEVRIPALTVSVRSTIPEGSTAALRDGRNPQPLPRWVPLAKPVGLALVALAIVPVVLWVVALARRARRNRPQGPARQSRRQRLAALDEIKRMDVGSPGALREGYARLDAWVRSSLQQSTGVAAAALTPAEIVTAVPRPPKALKMEAVQEILVACERAKYSAETPSEDGWRSLLIKTDQTLGADAR